MNIEAHATVMNLSVDQALKKATLHLQKNEFCEAKELFEAVLQAFPGNKNAQLALKSLNKKNVTAVGSNLMQQKINELINLYNAGSFSKVIDEAKILAQQYPGSFVIWNVMGAAAAQIDMLDLSIMALRQVIALKPDHAIAYNNLGNTFIKLDNYSDAIEAFKNAIKIQPDNLDALYNMSIALRLQGDFDEAMEACGRVVRMQPQNAKAHHTMGKILQDLGKPEEATKAYMKAIEIKPDYAEAISSLGSILLSQKKLNEAISAFEKVAALSLNDPYPYIYVSECLRLQGNYEDAMAACARALQIEPESADTFNAIGNIWKKQYKLENAQNAFEKAIEIQPDFVGAYINLSDCLRLQSKLEAAINVCDKALEIDRLLPDAHTCMGTILQQLGKINEAIQAYMKAIEIKPDHAKAHTNLSTCYLMQNDFVKAFEHTEWRWLAQQDNIGSQFKSNKPSWTGEQHEKVFVWKEQGIGDELMLSSMFVDLIKKSENIVIECDSRLIPLYERSFPKNIQFINDRNQISEGDYDSQIAIGSLPKYLRHELNDFKSVASGWLSADGEKVNVLREKLRSESAGKIIGISWLTMAALEKAQYRNVSLPKLAEYLTQIPGKYVSLQYGDVAEEVDRVSYQTGINISRIEEIDNFRDIDGLAALISACDLVISIDNLTVHLAGSLGVDTRVILPKVADARWGTSTRASYWYDSVTLYRQEDLGDWCSPLNHLVNDLTA